LSGEAFVFEGMNHTSYKVAYTENPDCMSHHTHEDVVRLSIRARETTLHELWLQAKDELGGNVVIEFSREVIQKLVCPRCNDEEEIFGAVGTVPYERGRCRCSGEMRIVQTAQTYTGTEPYGSRRLNELGLPIYDVFVARNDDAERAYLIEGDAADVLGELSTTQERG
jgi:hypothetical protein